jgi:cell division septum initiation protein DivIVA
MASGVGELIEMLYNMVSDAWGLPLGAEKCVIERDKVLDLLDEIKAQLPTELAEAKRLVNARAEFIANAKKEADTIKKAAEEHARRLVEEQAILKTAKAKANEIISIAESKAAELKKAANEYADDALRRTESAIAEALDEVRQSRVRFRSISSSAPARQTEHE